MRIDIITVLPEMLEGFVHESILARAEKKGLAEIRLHNLRDYTLDKWRRIDDYPYGGSAGMVMQCEPIDRCISALKAERDYDEVIFTSPDGERFDQHMANELSLKGNLIILAGHYKGIDQRVRDHLITKEISIGDFVLTGGELVAAMIADAIVRVVPGVIGDEQSALSDCFQDDLLAEQFRLGLKNIVELMTGKDRLMLAQQNLLQSKYLAILNIQLLQFYQGN